MKISKITAKTRHQITGPKSGENHYTAYKIQHLALTTIITCSARFLSVNFCHCGALTKVYWLTLRSTSMESSVYS